MLGSSATVAAETAVITGVSRIYLRTGPGTSYEPDGVVVGDEPVTVLGKTGSWVKIETLDHRVGFVYGGYLSVEEGAAIPVIDPPPPAAVAPAEIGSDNGALPPAPVSSPDPAAVGDASPGGAGEAWQSEVSDLKAEIGRLRMEMERAGARGRRSGDASVSTPLSALPTRKPFEIATPDSESSNLRTAGIALLSLVIGWVFGAGFARRRNRPQRGRLRF